VLLALRNLTRDRTRFGLSVEGVSHAATVFFCSRGCRAEFLGELPETASGPGTT
jgi:hypothetical protein